MHGQATTSRLGSIEGSDSVVDPGAEGRDSREDRADCMSAPFDCGTRHDANQNWWLVRGRLEQGAARVAVTGARTFPARADLSLVELPLCETNLWTDVWNVHLAEDMIQVAASAWAAPAHDSVSHCRVLALAPRNPNRANGAQTSLSNEFDWLLRSQ